MPNPPPAKSFLRRHITPILVVPIIITGVFAWYRLQFHPDFGPRGTNRRKDVQFFGYTVIDNSKDLERVQPNQGEFANIEESEE
jgi:hypothetical protein